MSFRRLLSQTVTVVNPTTTTDEYGNTVPSWGAGSSSPGLLQQTESTEVTVGRDTVVTGWLLFLPAGTVVSEHSRVTESGRTFEVVGQPNMVNTPRGPHHIECRLVSSVG